MALMGKTANYAAARLPHKDLSLAATPLQAAFTPQTCPPHLESGWQISGIILLSALTSHTISIFWSIVRQFVGLDPTLPSSAERRLKSGPALLQRWVKLVMMWLVLHLSSQQSQQPVPVRQNDMNERAARTGASLFYAGLKLEICRWFSAAAMFRNINQRERFMAP